LKCLAVLYVLENNKTYVNQNPHCEPQLGKRGLYRPTGGQQESGINELALLWVLNFSDGSHTLLDIADRANLEFGLINQAANALLEHGLLKECAE
jgi:aminopeptidase-like protein